MCRVGSPFHDKDILDVSHPEKSYLISPEHKMVVADCSLALLVLITKGQQVGLGTGLGYDSFSTERAETGGADPPKIMRFVLLLPVLASLLSPLSVGKGLWKVLVYLRCQ